MPQVHRGRRPGPNVDRNRARPPRGLRCHRCGYRADWQRGDRNFHARAAPKSQATVAVRPAPPNAWALNSCHAQCRRVTVGADRKSIRQFGEQREHDRTGTGAEIGDAPGARRAVRSDLLPPASVSTTVSVSGRGTSTAGDSARRKPQNSLTPVMRATGSRASRRAVSASMRPSSASSRARALSRTRPP